MEITFCLPHVFSPESSSVENAIVLRAALDFLIDVNVAYLRYHPYTPPLYMMGVRYGRTQIWDSIPALQARGYGDCKSLSAALIAQYRVRGIKATPAFRFMPKVGNSSDYHILVQVNNGQYEDPSKALGMGQNENRWFLPRR